MTAEDLALEIDVGKIREAQSHADFSENAWLIFYLAGEPDDLDALNVELRKLDATNLDGSEGCFVYAKVPVPLNEDEIREKIETVRQLAGAHEIVIDIVDLDPTDEIHSKKFFTLWKASQ